MGVLVLAVMSCNKPDNPELQPVLTSTSDLTCRGMVPLKGDDPGPDKSCVRYSFEGTTLTMTHYNAGFNCCPGKIFVDLQVRGDSLIIIEADSVQECRCTCRYDVDLTLENLNEGTYHVKFIEPLVQNRGFLKFTLDLKAQPEGMICVTRDFIPWGE